MPFSSKAKACRDDKGSYCLLLFCCFISYKANLPQFHQGVQYHPWNHLVQVHRVLQVRLLVRVLLEDRPDQCHPEIDKMLKPQKTFITIANRGCETYHFSRLANYADFARFAL